MYNGPQQGQLRQHLLAAFFLNGQCSWMNRFKQLNLRISSSVHFPCFQPHFFVFVQGAHAVCGEGRTRGAVGADQL
jgi:hypothetical protein